MDNKVTKERFDRHLEYDWIKYIAIIALAIFVWVMVYQMSSQLDDFQKLDIACVAPSVTAEINTKIAEDKLELLGEETPVVNVNFDNMMGDESTVAQLLQTRGTTSDLFITTETLFKRYAMQGFLLSFTEMRAAKGADGKTIDYFPDGSMAAVDEFGAYWTLQLTEEDYKAFEEAKYTQEQIDSIKERYDGKAFGIVLNKIQANTFFNFAHILDKDGKDTGVDETYVIGVIGASLGGGFGCGGDMAGGNRGVFNRGKKDDTNRTEAFDFLKSIFSKDDKGAYRFKRYDATVKS